MTRKGLVIVFHRLADGIAVIGLFKWRAAASITAP